MRKNLVICPAGDNSLHKNWLVSDRSFDIMVIYYGDNPSNVLHTCEYLICHKGYKYELAVKVLIAHFATNPEFYANYEYIWYPDSDLLIAAADIDRMFVLARERNAEMFQPSIANALYPETYDQSKAWASWKETCTNVHTQYRRVTHPESMMPGFSKWAWEHIFIRSLVLFPQYRAGWGIESLWHTLSQSYNLTKPLPHFVFDDVRVIHTKPVGDGSCELHELGKKELAYYRNPYLPTFETILLEEFPRKS